MSATFVMIECYLNKLPSEISINTELNICSRICFSHLTTIYISAWHCVSLI